MVGILTSMKFAMLRHSPSSMRIVGWIGGAVLVVITWRAGFLAADDGIRSDMLMLIFLAWALGCVLGPVTMSGAGVLRAEYFTLLPVTRSRLALGLLGAVFPGVASGYLLLAFLAVSVHALRSPLTLPLAVLGAVLLWVLTITTSRLVYAVLGAAMKTWLGIEISAVQFGVLVATLFTGWIVVLQATRTVPDLMATGLPEGVSDVLAVVPTSWPLLVVDAAAEGRGVAAAGWLLGLAGLTLLALLAAARMLRPDLGSRRSRPHRRLLGSRVLTGRTLLPDTPLGVVVGKELRQWWRDPWRKLELRTATYTGLITGLFALSAPEAAPFAPLAGAICAFMISLGGCNLYGQDGSAVWLSIVGQRADTARVEIRGRQIAMLILAVPPAVVVSAVLIIVTQAWWAVWVLAAALPALFGISVGVAVLMSAVGVSPGVDPRRRVGPNDAGGDLSLQAQVAFWGTTLFFLPTAGVIVWSLLSGSAWLQWAAIGFGVASGAAGYWVFGRMAIGYLATRMPTVYARIRYPGDREALGGSGALGWLESSSQKSEDTAREAKEKAKRSKAAARRKAAALD